MVSLTLSVSEDIKREMDNFPEINWSVIARAAIKRKIVLLKEMDALLSKSKLNIEDALDMGRRVNKSATKRLFKDL